MEFDRPGDDRKNRRDAMAEDSPGDSESADDVGVASTFFFAETTMAPSSLLPAWSEMMFFLKGADEEEEVVATVEVDSADVDASSGEAA